jgi:hypothetical protein
MTHDPNWLQHAREARAELDSYDQPTPASGMPHTPAQPLASGTDTSGTGSGRGTGVREAHGTAQAFEEGRRIAVSMMDRAEAKYRHENGIPHLREHCETCAEEYWSNRLRSVHYREAAESIRKYADGLKFAFDATAAVGMRRAAGLLDSTARDLSGPGEER